MFFRCLALSRTVGKTTRAMMVIQNGDADADDALLELFARIGEAGLNCCREVCSELRGR